jgi:nucleoside-diphosphate-sugar epimerase
MDSKILILGSEGFIGNHLVAYFLGRGWQVYGCDLFETARLAYNYRKISRLSPELDEVFAGKELSVCINAAGSGNVNYSMTHPFTDFEANSLDTIRVLDSIRRLQPHCKYLHISSAAVYGNPRRLPITENDPTSPLSPYGWHKLISEHLCREYHSIYKIRTVAVRPFSVYGPGLRKQLLWDLFQKITSATNGVVELWGTGNESRDFIYIGDLVKSLHLLLENAPMEGETYNLASGKEITIKEVANLFAGLIDPSVGVVFNQHVREGDPLNWRADISRIQSLGFRPGYELADGIKLVAQWMKDQK